jgi:RNA polymerase sigma-70 factor, ECF subfamily
VGIYSLDCFDEFTAKFIRSKVRQLIGRAGFKEADRQDLTADFVLDLLQRRKSFDADIATWEAFVIVVCENRFVTILEHRRAEMRSHKREAGSLNRPIKDGEGNETPLGATLDDSQGAKHTGQDRRSDEESWDMAHDIAAVLSTLTPQLRQLAEALMSDSKSAARRELGVSQGTLYELLGRMRARFEKAGLRDYMK